MEWIGILFVFPIWGALSAQLFFSSWLAFANLLINFLGFAKGAVSRKMSAMGMGVAILGVVLFGALLRLGSWLLTDVLPFGKTEIENVIYWAFVALSALYVVPQIPSKLRKSWRNAMVPGSLEADILERKLAHIT